MDVLVPLPKVPATEDVKTEAFLAQLTRELCSSAAPVMELGANCNTLLAAARLGLRSAAVCSLGKDGPGAFLSRELQVRMDSGTAMFT